MKIAVFSAKKYDQESFKQWADSSLKFSFFDVPLDKHSAKLTQGYAAVCVFVNDDLSQPVLAELKAMGVGIIALRCAGFNNVDLAAAKELGLRVARVPAYSPDRKST